ncbi:MAG: ComF family protein [Candidatus Nealsonbacteria bacterium]|nr:ComF family protein [Candidatus Nealsonbacteria bacterium]
MKIKNFLLDILFPKFCFNCKKEGIYLCEDCKSCLEISENVFCLCETPQRPSFGGKCPKCSFKKLDGLYFALSYQNKTVKKLIHQFKYEPFIKDLSENLADLIIAHFQTLNKGEKDFEGKILIPIPLTKKKLKNRGFNQAEEIAKKLSEKLKIPVIADCLIKVKENLPQMELSLKERQENIKGVFEIIKKEKIQGKKIMLVDDVYTTGSTMEEAAKTLKESEAKEVFGVVVARGS